MLAPQAAYFAELFDTKTRLSGFAFAREIGSVLAGGFLPLVATALLAWTGHWWAVLAYMAVLTAITLAALAAGPETRDNNIIANEDPHQNAASSTPAAASTTAVSTSARAQA